MPGMLPGDRLLRVQNEGEPVPTELACTCLKALGLSTLVFPSILLSGPRPTISYDVVVAVSLSLALYAALSHT